MNEWNGRESGATTAISISKKKRRRGRPGVSCADILRNTGNTRNKTSATIKYGHVDRPMYKYLSASHTNVARTTNDLQE